MQTRWFLILSLPGTVTAFWFVFFCVVRELGLAFGLPGTCSSFLWLSLGVTLDLGKVITFTASLRMPLGSMEFFVRLPEIFTMHSGWNLTRYLKGFNNSMIRNLAHLETDIWILMGNFFRSSKLNVPRGKEKPSKALMKGFMGGSTYDVIYNARQFFEELRATVFILQICKTKNAALKTI